MEERQRGGGGKSESAGKAGCKITNDILTKHKTVCVSVFVCVCMCMCVSVVQGCDGDSIFLCQEPMAAQCQTSRRGDAQMGTDIWLFFHAPPCSFLTALPEGRFHKFVSVAPPVFMFYLFFISAFVKYVLHLSDEEGKHGLCVYECPHIGFSSY